MSPKIEKIRDSMADLACRRLFKTLTSSERESEAEEILCFKKGFNEAWALHEKMVAPMLSGFGTYVDFYGPDSFGAEILADYKKEIE